MVVQKKSIIKFLEIKYTILLLVCFAGLLSIAQSANGQNLLYAEIQKKDNKNIKFEILGKVDGFYLVYKKIARKNYISSYDTQMQIQETIDLDFLPENLFDIDFIRYPDFFIIIYQYQKNKTVFCNAAKVDVHGKLKQPVSTLSATDIGFFANQKIFKMVCSEDKQQILVCKKNVISDIISVEARLFNPNFQLVDSVSQQYNFNARKDNVTDFSVDNLGNIYFTKELRKFNGDNINTLILYQHRLFQIGFSSSTINLNEYFVTGSSLKLDNFNNKIVLNSFFLNEKQDIAEGLFTAIINPENLVVEKSAFNLFSDETKKSFQSEKGNHVDQQTVLPENILLKKNGSFILMTEDFYKETMSQNNNTNFYDPSFGYSTNDFYMYNQYYNNYRSPNSFNNFNSTRYYYKDIIMVGVDQDLNMEWVNQIKKNQVDVEQDNFLSFTTLNMGTQIQYLFIDKDPQHEIISMHGLFSDGTVKRYPALKNHELGYEFMPRLSKQVGSKELIMPFIYMGKIGFSKIIF